MNNSARFRLKQVVLKVGLSRSQIYKTDRPEIVPSTDKDQSKISCGPNTQLISGSLVRLREVFNETFRRTLRSTAQSSHTTTRESGYVPVNVKQYSGGITEIWFDLNDWCEFATELIEQIR